VKGNLHVTPTTLFHHTVPPKWTGICLHSWPPKGIGLHTIAPAGGGGGGLF